MQKEQNKQDEIDLIELFKVLWQKKVWIVLTAFVTTLFAGVYAFTAKEQWTSKATVIAPRITELGNILPLRSEYARITGGEFSPGKLASDLHNYFRHFLLSDDLKREFAEQSSWVKEKLNGKTEQQQRQFISEFINDNLVIQKPDNKKKDDTELEEISLRLSFSAETPEDAQDVLKQYIEFINHYAINDAKQEFKIGFNLLLDNLKFNKAHITSKLNEAKTVQVENLTNALDISKKAGIKDFSKSTQSVGMPFAIPEYLTGEAKLNISDSKLADGTYLFMLGEKYLQAQLDTAKDKAIIYPLDYYTIDRQLSQLEPLSAKLDDVTNVKAYRYLASPDYPVTKDKPKKAIILLIGLFIGLILSSFVVLLSSLIKDD